MIVLHAKGLILGVRGDHFKIKSIENCCKFEIFLVKIGTYGMPNPFVGSDVPPGPGSSAHVAHVLALLQATWAEVAGPGGTSDQKIKLSTVMYLILLSYTRIYKDF